MSAPPTELLELIGQLQHKSSRKRRSAAKKLRKLKAEEAGSALLAALRNETRDKRTWETQYQMIMALGESSCVESLDFLLQLTEQQFEATMVYVALGDAVTRLDLSRHGNIGRSLKIFKSTDNTMLIVSAK